MNLNSATRIASLTASALGVLATVVACQGTTSIQGEGSIAGVGGSIAIKHEGAQKTLTVTNSTGAPIDIRFSNKNGSPVGGGTITIESGGTVTVPEGATHATLKSPPSTPPAPGWSSGAEVDLAGSTPSQRAKVGRISHRLLTVSIVPVLGDEGTMGNVTAEFEVSGPAGMSLDDCWNRVLPVLSAGPGAPVPQFVNVVSYMRFSPDGGGGRLRVSDVGAFTHLELTWNGELGYASLLDEHNVSRTSLANGWETCEILVPASDFESPFEINDLAIDMTNNSDMQPLRVTGSVRYLP